jgi:hypothetical protein
VSIAAQLLDALHLLVDAALGLGDVAARQGQMILVIQRHGLSNPPILHGDQYDILLAQEVRNGGVADGAIS